MFVEVGGRITLLPILFYTGRKRIDVYLDKEFEGKKIAVHPNDNTATIYSQNVNKAYLISQKDVIVVYSSSVMSLIIMPRFFLTVWSTFVVPKPCSKEVSGLIFLGRFLVLLQQSIRNLS